MNELVIHCVLAVVVVVVFTVIADEHDRFKCEMYLKSMSYGAIYFDIHFVETIFRMKFALVHRKNK